MSYLSVGVDVWQSSMVSVKVGCEPETMLSNNVY